MRNSNFHSIFNVCDIENTHVPKYEVEEKDAGRLRVQLIRRSAIHVSWILTLLSLVYALAEIAPDATGSVV